MRVKRFVGDNVAETMGKIKRELGTDAVILQTREFREGGILGFFGKQKVEIMAAIEEQPLMNKQPQPQAKPQFQSSPAKGNPYTLYKEPFGSSVSNASPNSSLNSKNPSFSGVGESGRNSAGLQGQTLEFLLGESATATERLMSTEKTDTTDVNYLEAELQSMRKLLENMSRQMEGLDGEQGVWPVPLQRWAEILRGRGVSARLIKKLLKMVQQNVREEDWTIDTRVRNSLKEGIRQICSNTAAIQPGVRSPRVVALIGPTGVGKTTTIGKLAAGFSIVDKRRVALITADTYRVAAVEQLKTFGEIIGVPVDVVMTPSGLKEAIRRHEDKELIFIDTAGRSPHHDLHMSELRAFLDKAQPDLTLLVMSAATHTADQAKIFERFEPLTTHLIFTKLDETVNGGALLNLLEKTELPVAYITNGQNVPDDIEVATPERLVRYILGEGDNRE